MSEPAQGIAVIDLGSNATRLLLHPDLRREEITGLGRAVSGGSPGGAAGEGGVERTLAAVEGYLALARERRVQRVVAIATSAVRDEISRTSANTRAAATGVDRLLKELARRGVEVYVVSGEQEAALTFLGATRSLPPGGPVTVIDVGGGSTEICVGRAGEQPAFVHSTDLGSVRCTRDYERFTGADRERLRSAVRSAVAKLPLPPESAAGEVLAASGTATTLARILGREGDDEIRAREVEELLDTLQPLSPMEISTRHDLPPLRAEVVRTGLALLAATVSECAAESFRVATGDLLDGAACDLGSEGVGILTSARSVR